LVIHSLIGSIQGFVVCHRSSSVEWVANVSRDIPLPENPFDVFACRIRRLWTGQYWQYKNERKTCQAFLRFARRCSLSAIAIACFLFVTGFPLEE
jgi:hypothetical protein